MLCSQLCIDHVNDGIVLFYEGLDRIHQFVNINGSVNLNSLVRLHLRKLTSCIILSECTFDSN